MAIENILNKIIASYKKKKLSFEVVPDLTSEQSQSHESKEQNYIHKSDSFKSEAIYSSETLPDSYNHVAEMEDDSVSDINIIDWRAYKRKDISIPIDFTTSADKLYKENTKNISSGGLFIETQRYNNLVRNQKIVMVFTIVEGRKPFKLTGKVIRVQPEGIAVQFHNISPFDCASIEESLNKMSR